MGWDAMSVIWMKYDGGLNQGRSGRMVRNSLHFEYRADGVS